MTEVPGRRPRFARPALMLPILAAVVVIATLLTPEQVQEGRAGLSTYSTGPAGGGLVYELAGRIGWRTARRRAPLDSIPNPSAVQVVLAPGEALGAKEVHRLLESVRRGGGLIAAVADDPELADSLHVQTGEIGRLAPERGEACLESRRRTATNWMGMPPLMSIRWRRPPPSPPTTLAHLGSESTLPAAVGFTLGHGRVALVSEADVFQNDIVRECEWEADVAVVRMLEYARGAGSLRTVLVFDEYHHGFGMHPGSIGAVFGYLADAASGHVLLQALAAGLVLLLAVAPRPILPRDPERVLRRSPLEHADALAHAYMEVHATRTAVARLADGARRRAGRPVGPTTNVEAFLARVAATRPGLGGDVTMIERGLREPLHEKQFTAVGEAIERLEIVLTSTPAP